jgi:hypothetical protein
VPAPLVAYGIKSVRVTSRLPGSFAFHSATSAASTSSTAQHAASKRPGICLHPTERHQH